MTTRKLTERLHTWEAWHPEWRENVRGALYEHDDALVLIDPQLPADGPRAELLAELDARLDAKDRELHVLCTVFWHERSAPELVERYGKRARWWFPNGARALPERAQRLRAGAELPAGVQALATARGDEVLLWIPSERTLFAGDVLLGGKSEGLRLCPQGWLADGNTRALLADSIRPALELDLERVHVGHGTPVTAGARAALASALARCGPEQE